MWQFQIHHQLYVTRDKHDISSVWKGSFMRDWQIEWNTTVLSSFLDDDNLDTEGKVNNDESDDEENAGY